MAKTNMQKNKSLYFPYLLTCIVSVAMFYIMESIINDKGISAMPQGYSLLQILQFGVILIGIFSVVFLFYTNSFLMKRRKKELGLYNVLGMEKKHIAMVLFFEAIYVCAISLIAGILLGIVLNKLMMLLLGHMIQFEVKLGFQITYNSLLYTIIMFVFIFALILIFNLIQIIRTNPIELLHSDKAGEREPKAKWSLAVMGVVLVAIGYYISITTKSPLQAIQIFFFAVIFVVIGTYLLFTAGSIAILKLLKKNKKFYYKTNHYVAVSGMIYRMKQNAVGLANICVLSTMVLVILSTTVSLYIGSDEEIINRYPYDCSIYINTNKDSVLQEDIQQIVTETAEAEGVHVSKNEKSCLVNTFLEKKNKGYKAMGEDSELSLSEWIYTDIYMKEDYEKISGKMLPQMAEQDICVYTSIKEEKENKKVILGKKEYNCVKYLDVFPGIENASAMSTQLYCIVVKDQKALSSLKDQLEGNIIYSVGIDMQEKDEDKIDASEKFYAAVKTNLADYKFDSDSLYYETRQAEQDDFYATYGGFLFLGIFLGILFLMATTLIIYYKQISEGYEDQDKFHIMEKVGMTHKEIKSSIQSQVLLVFFIPLFIATIHVCAAFPLIVRLLYIFNLTNVPLFVECSLFVFLIFTIVYAIIYKTTAKSYFNIVTAK